MAKNDQFLLDAIIQARQNSGVRRPVGETFELLAFEQLLKDYDLSGDEIELGWVDGEDDGGIDGFYTIVNGRLAQQLAVGAEPKQNVHVEVYLITAKHHATFLKAPLDSLLSTVTELFDFGVEKSSLVSKYSEALIEAREELRRILRAVAASVPALKFHIIYASRGDSGNVSDAVSSQMHRVAAGLRGCFSACEVNEVFAGGAELLSMYRRVKKFDLTLEFNEHLTQKSQSYVLLCRLDAYAKFLTDEDGRLRRYLFDSNVRDYLGVNSVNKDIRATLESEGDYQFWWLNNGITILATAGNVIGKEVRLVGVQIVNGLQTSESVFEHFRGESPVSGDKSILVRIVISTNEEMRDRIIRATNNQTRIDSIALHATERVQRDIEDALATAGWAYERRENDQRHAGASAEKRVSLLYAAGAMLALGLKDPVTSSRVKGRRLRNQLLYDSVFASSRDVRIWPAVVRIAKRVDSLIAQVKAASEDIGFKWRGRSIATWRNPAALMLVAKRLGRFDYGDGDLVRFEENLITEQDVKEVGDLIVAVSGGQSQGGGVKQRVILKCCALLAQRHMIAGLDSVRSLESIADHLPDVSEETAIRVNSVLPEQPWSGKWLREVASQLGMSRATVRIAVRMLIRRGLRYRQENGMLFDNDGKVVVR